MFELIKELFSLGSKNREKDINWKKLSLKQFNSVVRGKYFRLEFRKNSAYNNCVIGFNDLYYEKFYFSCNTNLRVDNFKVSDDTRVTFACAEKVIEIPCERYNVLRNRCYSLLKDISDLKLDFGMTEN